MKEILIIIILFIIVIYLVVFGIYLLYTNKKRNEDYKRMKKESDEQFKCSDCGDSWDKPANLNEIADWIEKED